MFFFCYIRFLQVRKIQQNKHILLPENFLNYTEQKMNSQPIFLIWKLFGCQVSVLFCFGLLWVRFRPSCRQRVKIFFLPPREWRLGSFAPGKFFLVLKEKETNFTVVEIWLFQAPFLTAFLTVHQELLWKKRRK